MTMKRFSSFFDRVSVSAGAYGVRSAMEASTESKQEISKVCGIGDNSSKRSTMRETLRI